MLDVDILDVDTVTAFENQHIDNLYVSGVHGDGSCMIHSFLYIIDAKYRELDNENKRIYGRKYRTNLVEDILNKVIKSKSKSKKNVRIRKFFEDLKPTLKNEDIETFITEELSNPDVWLDEIFLVLIELIMNINVVIFTNGVYFVRGNIYDKNRDIILFHYLQNAHYEPIFYKKKNNEEVYAINNDDHEELYDKIIRGYLKTFRKSPSLTSPVKSAKEKSPTLSLKSQSPKEKSPVKLPHIEPPHILGSHDFDPESSTSIDYYENFIMEDDIIFEEINDLNEIVLTRIDKTIPIVYSKEQTINQINDLYSFMTKGIKRSMSFNFNELVNNTTITSVNNMNFSKMIPIICTSKEFYTDDESDMDHLMNVDHSKNTDDYLSERSTFMKEVYKKIQNKLRDHHQILFSDTLNEDSNHVNTIIRLCHSLFDSLMHNDVVDRSSSCRRYIHSTKSLNPIQIQKTFERNMEQNQMINDNNFLEMYKVNENNHPVHGYFLSNRYKKFSSDEYSVFNVSEYYESLVNFKPEDTITISLHTGGSHKGIVTKNKKGIIHIQMNVPIELKNKTYDKFYYYTNNDQLHKNWFSVYGDNTKIFTKSMIFEKDHMFIFHPKDKEVFFQIILPTIDEYISIKKNKWDNLQECYADLKQYFNIEFKDIQNEWVVPKKQKYNNEYTNFEVVKHKQSFNDAKLLQFPESSVYYPKLHSSILKRNDSILHRMILLNESFDHGLMKMNEYILLTVATDEEPVNKALYVNELDKLDLFEIKEKPFYDNVEDLIAVKNQLLTNYKYGQLEKIIMYLDAHQTYINEKDNIRNELRTKKKDNKNYYLTNIKPQNIENKSFLKGITVLEGNYVGSRNIVDFEDVFNNVESTRYMNFEKLGTMDDDDETITISSKKSIEQLINQISLEFGTFKLSAEKISYISDNLVHFVAQLFEERKDSFMKKNPNVKDLNKMFKSQNEKTKYVEYINVIIIGCFILLFVSIDHKHIEFYNINKTCAEFFKIQGFPLANNKSTSSDKKNTLTYLSCVLSKLYGNNTNLVNSERNEKKILQVTKKILNEKKELSIQIKSVQLQKEYTKTSIQSKSFINTDSTLSKCKVVQLNDSLDFVKTTFENDKKIYIKTPLRLMQVKKKNEISTDIEYDVIKFIDFTPISKPVHVDDNENVIHENLNLLSKTLNDYLTDMAFKLNIDFTILHDRFVSFKNQTIDEMKAYNDALYRYATNHMLILVSKVINKYNNEQHHNLLVSNSVRYLKDNQSDKDFVRNIVTKKTKDSVEMVYIQRLYENEALYTTIKALDLPKLIHKECFKVEDIMKLSLHYLKIIFDYCFKLLDISNEDMSYIVKNILDALTTFTNHIDNNVDYKHDVEHMREKDKQDKYNQKDRMGDDERLLYIMLENIGVVPEMGAFSKTYAETETLTESVPVFNDDDNQTQDNNPEYETYDGENGD
jgi:hypothetical protein